MKSKDMIEIIKNKERRYYRVLQQYDREYNRLLDDGRLETDYGSVIKESALIYSWKWVTIHQLMKELEIESEEN